MNNILNRLKKLETLAGSGGTWGAVFSHDGTVTRDPDRREPMTGPEIEEIYKRHDGRVFSICFIKPTRTPDDE
jgi:hypothetical protein